MQASKLPDGSPPNDEQPLDSWKEIARYLNRSVRTVQSWETQEGLPVRRHQHLKAGTVYAHRSEIDAWLEGRAAMADGDATSDAWPWRRRWLPIALVALLVAAVISWRLTREPSSTDPDGSAPIGNLEGRDWLLIASLDNLTGDERVDGTIEAALRRELAGFVKLAPEERLGDSLRLLERPADAPIDASLARQVARRDKGILAVLIGRVERDAASFRLTVDLLGPAEGNTLASLSETAEGPEDLLPAINDLSLRIRETLGDIVDNGGSEPAAPPSLQVLRLHTLAERRLREGGARADRAAEQLLREALAEDPGFAPSRIHLAWTLARLGRPPPEFLDEADRAVDTVETTDRATPVERYFVLGSRHHLHYLVSRRKEHLDAALAHYHALLELDPGHFWARTNTSTLLFKAGLGREALIQAQRSLEARPDDIQVLSEVVLTLVTQEGDLEQAREYVEKARRLQQDLGTVASHSVALLEFFRPHELWVEGNVEAAVAEVDRIVASLTSGDNENLRYLAGEALAFYLGLGMFGRAEELQRTYAIYPDGRWEWLIAWRRADRERLAALLRKRKATANPSKLAKGAWDLAHLGFASEAEAWLAEVPDELPRSAEAHRLAARGTLDLAAGRYREAIANLENSLEPLPQNSGTFFRASCALARALAASGDLHRAVQLLERASEQKPKMMFGRNYWMEARVQLAALYRALGRESEAQTIEAELRRNCAWAEPEFPILRELEGPSSPLPEPAS